MNYQEIISDIDNKNTKPIYFLIGEESYHIDRLINYFLNNLLETEEKEFNQIIFYGNDSSVEKIISECKIFPFGSEKRLIVVKEGQYLKQLELLEHYIKNPQTSTCLVICYNKKTIDKRKKIGKILFKECVVFESKELYENQLPDWIIKYLKKDDFTINNYAISMLLEHTGNTLSKIVNELEKLKMSCSVNKEITSELIEDITGISKEYNIFELQHSIGKKDFKRTNTIILYFSKNKKKYNIILIISMLFSYFEKVMLYHQVKNKNPQSISKILKINPYFISQYKNTSLLYSQKQLFNIFKYLKEYDLKAKGVGNKNSDDTILLKELTLKILDV